jgi:heat shock protein HtpX
MMWEMIRANRRKSWMLFIAMGLCLVVLGYLIGETFFPAQRGPSGFPGQGGVAGVIIALLVWFLMSLVSYFSGDSIMLAVSKAREVTPDVHPRLYNVVEEMRIAAGLPVMPKVYIIDDPAPNAFATGRKPENCAVAVTAGLLERLNRDELQGVVAHEMSHIANRDVQFMTFAGILLGGIVLISHIFARSMFYSGSSRRFGGGGKSGGQGQAIVVIVALAFAILAPILARLLYFAISRKREYLADASGARLTRYPEGLASALEKISSSTKDLKSANKVTAPMYIVNPLKEKGRKLSDLTSTHPPISQRVKILRSMSGGANYIDYQRAFTGVTGEGAAVIPSSGLKDREKVDIRDASAGEPGRKKNLHEVGDLMRAVNKYAFLVCACGLKIKIPPDFKKEKVDCPRCGRDIEIPTAELAAVLAAADAGAEQRSKGAGARKPAPEKQVYTRKGEGWESFHCNCGRLVQISPSLEVPNVRCKDCGGVIEIRG